MMAEKHREYDGRLVGEDEDPFVAASMVVDADGERKEKIRKAAEALKKNPPKPIVIAP
jgi:hypothetical protein